MTTDSFISELQLPHSESSPTSIVIAIYILNGTEIVVYFTIVTQPVT